MIGPSEIIVVAVLALLVFGPKRLPEIARQVGRALAEVRRVSREFEREVREVTEPFDREIRDAEKQARKTYAIDEDYSTYIPPAQPKDGPKE